MLWTLDSAHSHVGFSIRHMMISTVRGSFDQFDGEIDVDESDPARSRAEGRIQVASIDTGNDERDAHLRGADFFDAQTYPTITFKSRQLTSKGTDAYLLTGELTMRGVTREITLEAELSPEAKDPWGNMRRGVSLRGYLSRKDFGLTWNQTLETGGVLVDDKVKLEIDLEIVKAAPQEAAKLAEAEAQAGR